MAHLFCRGRASPINPLISQKWQEQRKRAHMNYGRLHKGIGREARGGWSGHIDFSPFSSVFPMSSQSFTSDYMIFGKEKECGLKIIRSSLSHFLGDWSSYFMGRRRKRGERKASLNNIYKNNSNKILLITYLSYSFWANYPQQSEVRAVKESVGKLLPLLTPSPSLLTIGSINVIDWLCLSLAHTIDEWEK